MSDQQERSVDEVCQLRAAVDRGTRDLASTRGLAERFWPVSADKPLERRPGAKGWLAFQVKRVLRKTMRWYVEPAFADQRIVNDALLRLVDDLSRRVDELEKRDSGPLGMRLMVCMPQVPFKPAAMRSSRTAFVKSSLSTGTRRSSPPSRSSGIGERVLTQSFLWHCSRRRTAVDRFP
jgi:hypothetical protein